MNGFHPYVRINTFVTDDPEKEYCFQVQSGFGQFAETENQVLLFLRKVTVDEK